jgi:hypothetical protein
VQHVLELSLINSVDQVRFDAGHARYPHRAVGMIADSPLLVISSRTSGQVALVGRVDVAPCTHSSKSGSGFVAGWAAAGEGDVSFVAHVWELEGGSLWVLEGLSDVRADSVLG